MITIGQWTIDWVSDGPWSLDGGMMFGRVPRVLWEQAAPPDSLNRIRLTCRTLVLRANKTCVLIDSGLGPALDSKMMAQLDANPVRGLLSGLGALGVSTDGVTHVILTHLHFDHVGGCVRRDETRTLVPTFPNARYLIQKGEWRDARTTHVLLRRSYVADTFLPLEYAGLVEWLDGPGEVLPDVHVEITGGHCAHHQMVRVAHGDEALVYPADLMPLASHINPAWVMAIDAYPLESSAQRTKLLHRAAERNWLVVLNHDPERPSGRIVRDEKGRFAWAANS